jgi:hypothetical protein
MQARLLIDNVLDTLSPLRTFPVCPFRGTFAYRFRDAFVALFPRDGPIQEVFDTLPRIYGSLMTSSNGFTRPALISSFNSASRRSSFPAFESRSTCDFAAHRQRARPAFPDYGVTGNSGGGVTTV